VHADFDVSLCLQYGNVWRTAGDIMQSWPEILRVLDSSVGLMQYSKPGAWADLDMLEVSTTPPPPWHSPLYHEYS